jgi:hypothetical protein
MARGGEQDKVKPMGDVMREAEKKETMDGGGRGNNDNADNGCYEGATLGRRSGGKLGQSWTKKDDDIWMMAVWRGNDNQ